MNRYERDREELTRLLQAAHEKRPSHGYHRLAHDVFLKTGWVFSHNLAHKCCKAAGIHSKAGPSCWRPGMRVSGHGGTPNINYICEAHRRGI